MRRKRRRGGHPGRDKCIHAAAWDEIFALGERLGWPWGIQTRMAADLGVTKARISEAMGQARRRARARAA